MQISLDDQNAHLAFGILDIWKTRAATPLVFGYLDICIIYHFKHRIWHLLFIMTISANFRFEISNKNFFFKSFWRLKCISNTGIWHLLFIMTTSEIFFQIMSLDWTSTYVCLYSKYIDIFVTFNNFALYTTVWFIWTYLKQHLNFCIFSSSLHFFAKLWTGKNNWRESQLLILGGKSKKLIFKAIRLTWPIKKPGQ